MPIWRRTRGYMDLASRLPVPQPCSNTKSSGKPCRRAFSLLLRRRGSDVVVAMSAATTSRDNRVGRLVRIQPPVDMTDQSPNCQRMPLRDDFVVAAGRD